MLTPAPQSPDDRGKHWLQAKIQQILADGAVVLSTPRFEGDPSCYWGTGLETSATLYLCLAGEPEPKALRFNRALLRDCGAGSYARQDQANMFIRRTLKKMGILSA